MIWALFKDQWTILIIIPTCYLLYFLPWKNISYGGEILIHWFFICGIFGHAYNNFIESRVDNALKEADKIYQKHSNGSLF